MTLNGWLQILIYFLLLLLVTKPLGVFMARVYNREKTFLDPVLRPIERLIYKLCRIDENREMRWTEYAVAMLLYSAISMIVLFLLQRLQRHLPFNPQHIPGVDSASYAAGGYVGSAFNTATSFTTNTNWQGYSGEVTMSYLTQMAGLAYHNFTSAAVGMALAIAFIRGIARREQETIGNFWVDTVRGCLWILLPLSIVLALALVSQGVVQNLKPYTTAQLVEKQTIEIDKKDADGNVIRKPDGTPEKEAQTIETQTIAQGPAASQVAIKQLGTNGGGFFNTNSSHPLENPTPLSNFVETLFILLIPAGLVYTFGKMVRDTRQGWSVFATMSLLFLAGVFICYPAEQSGNTNLTKMGIQSEATASQPGGNMEGKEVRFGISPSALWAVATSDASNGSVNSMHDSYTPIGGLVPLFNIQTGEVIFGGVGAGLYGMLLFAVVAVFIAGLMVGRTPEYLGKKIESKEVKMAMLALIACAASILILSAITSQIHFPKDGYWNPPGPAIANLNNNGPHGLSEILYTYSSSTGNN